MLNVETISLTGKELKWCYNHAHSIVDYWGGEKSLGSGTYGHNKVDGNLVGVKCELGMTRWLQRYFDDDEIKSNFKSFDDSGKRGDICCHGKIIEVKGLRPWQWSHHRVKEPTTYRRMVPPTQLKKYVKNNAIVVWVTSTGNTLNKFVEIKGWNYAYEVQNKGKLVQTICSNMWLKNDKDMRDMKSLVVNLKS